MTKKSFYQIIVFATSLIFSISFLIAPVNIEAGTEASTGLEQPKKETGDVKKDDTQQKTDNTSACKAKFGDGLIQYDGVCDNENGIQAFLNMLTRIAGFVMKIALLVAVIMIIYSGFQLLTSAGKPEAKTKVKDRLWNIAIGIILIGAAWLIVSTVYSVLQIDDLKWITPN